MHLTQTTTSNSEIKINEIFKNKIHLIWVPKNYGGLGFDLLQGLNKLQKIAEKDGSLAWMITLCAGANYFARNLKPEIAEKLFKNKLTIFGGSGMIGGTAEKKDNKYLINGKWRYATGSIYLTHFTFNAIITQNGIPILDENGNQQIKSFIIPKDDVTVIKDWKSMGMKETQTHAFEIKNKTIEKEYSFIYNVFYTQSILDQIPFQIFADLTFIVNYLGMAKHFLNLAKQEITHITQIQNLNETICEIENKIPLFVSDLEKNLKKLSINAYELGIEIHNYGVQTLKQLSHQILDVYLILGLKASHEDNLLNIVFKDFFTASQHKNFK